MNVQHFAIRCPSTENERKDRLILDLFEKHSRDRKSSQMIIFCQTKSECDQLAQSNQINSYPTGVLHGNLSQRRREEVIDKFRQGKIRFLITTDISARGLDIPQVDLVVLTSPPPVRTILISPGKRSMFRIGNLMFIDLDERVEQENKEKQFVFSMNFKRNK